MKPVGHFRQGERFDLFEERGCKRNLKSQEADYQQVRLKSEIQWGYDCLKLSGGVM